MDGIVGSYSDESIVLKESYNLGNVSSNGNYVGGICGGDSNKIGFSIGNTYNMGDINGQQYVGGIVGGTSSYTYVSESYNKAKISGKNYIGGISGYYVTQGTVRNCYNIEEISGETNIGGIVGGCANVYNIWISYCYNNGKIMATNSYLGGIVGKKGYSDFSYCYYEENTALFGIGSSTLTTGNDSGTTKLTQDQMPTVLSVINSDNAFVEDTNNINNGYPLLAWQVETTEK